MAAPKEQQLNTQQMTQEQLQKKLAELQKEKERLELILKGGE